MFTPGSTGKPNGVIMSHTSLCTGQVALGKRLGLKPTDQYLQVASHIFDQNIAENMGPMLFGACACIPSDHAGIIQPSEVPKLHTLIVAGESLTKYVVNL